VHPGYGFFSENTEFARAITSRGVTSSGPAEASRSWVTRSPVASPRPKSASRRARSKRGAEERKEVVKLATTLAGRSPSGGYGGGGRGMKVVNSADDASAALESASASTELLRASECYVERYLTRPRHIEMQSSRHHAPPSGSANVTAQPTTHQKLIEESPAPNFPDDVRRAMGEAAVKSRCLRLRERGTVEFLYQDGAFFFLEMNTRLQVEHP